jgi:hypothetical protein
VGGTRKKLEQWAKFEYGRNPVFAHAEHLTGNCRACAEYAAKQPDKPAGKGHKDASGKVVFEVQKMPESPPCLRCPKYRLYPGGREPGLHPGNALVVHLYRIARQDHRLDQSLVLTWTLPLANVRAALDEYREMFPTRQHRQDTLTRIIRLDGAARAAEQERVNELVQKQKAEMDKIKNKR